eukprot:TRINITY_DN6621_c0_g1_i1.p1 TRINITY_DN6621_c0_g1~~TRINITY_DN6621_c0_g1_i1.p1  ORF type:complete len:633 (-),score=68.42 TRINITY_DN6621_c0_g1_i1:71-1969(-)
MGEKRREEFLDVVGSVQEEKTYLLPDWEVADEGGEITYMDEESTDYDYQGAMAKEHKEKKVLGQVRATAIAGNDISSSVFYTIGVSTISAGQYSPISMVIVILVFYIFRNIYAEVVTALPVNGGSYNALLNTTSKGIAAVVAGLSMLSYLTTAVVSANFAAGYAKPLIGLNEDGVFWGTIIILLFVCLLNLVGLSESSYVATVMFFLHISVLTCLSAVCIVHLCTHGIQTLKDNWLLYKGSYNIPLSIYFGYCTALLGCSGFETSANYVEEQQEGVYPKTLRNMWLTIAIFNPLLSFLAIAILPINQIVDPNENYQVLYNMALVALNSRRWLSLIISADAVIVLTGAVLTSYVGILGLVRTMAQDRVLPSFFLARMWRFKTNWIIIVGFFLLAFSLMGITRGKVNLLSGVFTMAFLAVMAFFAIGNILLKYKRRKLPREITSPWVFVIFGLCAVIAGLIGNIVFDDTIVEYFVIYFAAVMIVIFIMFKRVELLRIILFVLPDKLGRRIAATGKKLKSHPIVFFTKTGNLSVIHKATTYVINNEITNWLRIVHVYETEENIPANLTEDIKFLDRLFPKVRIDLVLVKGTFNPDLVSSLSKKLNVAPNMMFITCPGDEFKHDISLFGGVRVITH